MSKIDEYIHAATRDNTRESYRSAVRHFEIEWKGFLPATADSLTRYLADHAETLSINTLRQRLSALSQWHTEQGFPDPTKAPVVRKVFRGIQALHPTQEKRAKPLQLEQLTQVTRWLEDGAASARLDNNRSQELRYTRDKALLLLGFWRGFRSDELTRLHVEHVEVVPGEGMSCYFPRTKGDRRYQGTTFRVPALSQLCPVGAYLEWISVSQLANGPLFRRVDRWGHVSNTGIHADSVAPLLRSILTTAGIASSGLYSGHSLRRGFANWAAANGWDVKTLMTYVGWKDIKSAMRYIDAADPFARHKIESGLSNAKQVASSMPNDWAKR